MCGFLGGDVRPFHTTFEDSEIDRRLSMPQGLAIRSSSCPSSWSAATTMRPKGREILKQIVLGMPKSKLLDLGARQSKATRLEKSWRTELSSVPSITSLGMPKPLLRSHSETLRAWSKEFRSEAPDPETRENWLKRLKQWANHELLADGRGRWNGRDARRVGLTRTAYRSPSERSSPVIPLGRGFSPSHSQSFPSIDSAAEEASAKKETTECNRKSHPLPRQRD
jgi:hypothetical protein